MADHRDLRETLAALYDDPDVIRRVVADAQLDGGRIDFAGGVDLIWFRVLTEAGKHGPAALTRLRAVAHRDYPEAMAKPLPLPPPVAQPLRDYLEWGWHQHRKLRLIGYHSRDKIQLTLDEVFIDLHARVGRRRPGTDRPLRLDKESDALAAWEDSTLVDLEGALRAAEERDKVGLVLLGDPGAGKTTLLRHLFCRIVADGPKAVGLADGLTPVLIRFSNIGDSDLVARGLAPVLRRVLTEQGFAAAGDYLASSEHAVLFLLDGLDEVRDEVTRVRMCRWLDDEVGYWPGSRFVATCRFAAWQREAVLYDQFLTADIQWLDPAKVRSFVQRWYLAVEVGQGGTPEEARAKAEHLLAALLAVERQQYQLREMTENPLLLGTICLVHYAGDRLPEKRARLYDSCIGFLLETWAERRAGQPSLPDGPARQVLQPLAWAMHERKQRVLSGAEVRAAIAPVYGQVPGLNLTIDEFLRRVRDDCGLLTGSDIDSYEFLHLSFQEYLAAAHARAAGRIEDLADRISEPYWRETILLAMSMDGVFVPFMRRVVAKRGLAANRDLLRACFDEVERIDPTPFQPALDPPATLGILQRVWARLHKRPQFDAHETLAALELFRNRGIAGVSVSRPDVVGGELPPTVAGIDWVHVAAATFTMGSSKTAGEPNYDEEAYDNETPAHVVRITRAFAIGRHPVTNASYGRFMAATKHAAPATWGDRRFNDPRQPVVGVNWDDAQTFCTWLTDELGDSWLVQLPSEAEWELAARGTDGRRYPWAPRRPTPIERCSTCRWKLASQRSSGADRPAPAPAVPRTWRATSGNGVATPGVTPTRHTCRLATIRVTKVTPARLGWSGAVPGTSLPGACARRFGSGATPGAGTGASGFGWCVAGSPSVLPIET